MLYIYNGKVYIKPLENMLVEVYVTKQGDEYNVEPTEKKVELNEEIKKNLYSITLENAYKMQNEAKASKKIGLE